jgi:hypothetical protein
LISAFLYKTDVTAYTPTSEESGFEASNLLDGLDSTFWKATSSATQEFIFDKGAALQSSFATSVFDAAAINIKEISYAADGTLWVCDTTTDKIYKQTEL